MAFSVIGFYSFFLLFVFASGAPTGHSQQDVCADVRNSVLLFNQMAKTVVQSGPKGIKNFTTSIGWMEGQDQCDPGTLRLNPERCINKMLNVLTSYQSFVKSLSEFTSCPVAHQMNPVLLQLHEDMSRCVKSRTEYNHHEDHISERKFQGFDNWTMELLCKYTMERLFSFSILTARVFSVGDPANHADSTEYADTPKCALQN
ncbi:unnamed protein product [Knipowitschia caucasica]